MSSFKCPQCDKAFRTESGLDWHKWHVHELPKSAGKPPKALSACQKCYDEGFLRGYEQGKKDWQIWYFCNVCGDKIVVRPNDQALIGYMRKHGWGHNRCHHKT